MDALQNDPLRRIVTYTLSAQPNVDYGSPCCSTWMVRSSGNQLAATGVAVVVVVVCGPTRQIASFVADDVRRRTCSAPRLDHVSVEVLRIADGWNGCRTLSGDVRLFIGLCIQNQ